MDEIWTYQFAANIEYLKVLEDYKFFVENYPNAIKNTNSELLTTCSIKLGEGCKAISNSGKILDAKKK